MSGDGDEKSKLSHVDAIGPEMGNFSVTGFGRPGAVGLQMTTTERAFRGGIYPSCSFASVAGGKSASIRFRRGVVGFDF